MQALTPEPVSNWSGVSEDVTSPKGEDPPSILRTNGETWRSNTRVGYVEMEAEASAGLLGKGRRD